MQRVTDCALPSTALVSTEALISGTGRSWTGLRENNRNTLTHREGDEVSWWCG